MRVAGGIGAARAGFYGRNDAQNPVAIRLVNAKAVGPVEPREWLRLRVTPVAGLCSFVYVAVNLAGVGGVADSALLVEYANPHHPGLARDGRHHVVEPFAVIAQHGIRRAAFDHVADAFRRLQRGLFQVPPVQADGGITKQREDYYHRPQQQQSELRPQTVAQAEAAPPRLSRLLSRPHAPPPPLQPLCWPPSTPRPPAPAAALQRGIWAGTSPPIRTGQIRRR